MRPDHERLSSRFRGAVLGAAIGDALAFPYQHHSRRFLRSLASSLTEEYTSHHSRFHPRGQHGYPTQILLATTEAIVAERTPNPEVVVDRLIPLWRENLLVEREESTTEAMTPVVRGLVDWRDGALGIGRAEAAPLVRVVPVALWDHKDVESLAANAGALTRITHSDLRVAACGAAAAAAIGGNLLVDELKLGEFLDRVAAAASRFEPAIAEALLDFPRILSQSEYRATRLLAALCPDSRYPASEDGLTEYCVPVLFTAIYQFLRSPYAYERVVESCVRLGGRTDVAAFLAGSMCGALVGLEDLPERLVGTLAHAERIHATTTDLIEAWVTRDAGNETAEDETEADKGERSEGA
jgi:ADP-ribosylglycohydrolase